MSDELGGDRPVRQILPQRVVFDKDWFGQAERPHDLLVTIRPGQVAVAVGVDADDYQQALVQAEVPTPAGPTMVVAFVDWEILNPEGAPTLLDGSPTEFRGTMGEIPDDHE